jgi:hypothetical protein
MPLDLFEQTMQLLALLEQRRVPYALAGGLALAVHGVPRATSDIDLLVPPQQVDAALAVARESGFSVEAMPMRFSDGMELRRITRIEGDESLTLDLLLVNENLLPVFEGRRRYATGAGEISVVSREGLIAMKASAGREQDMADIRRLQELDR